MQDKFSRVNVQKFEFHRERFHHRVIINNECFINNTEMNSHFDMIHGDTILNVMHSVYGRKHDKVIIAKPKTWWDLFKIEELPKHKFLVKIFRLLKVKPPTVDHICYDILGLLPNTLSLVQDEYLVVHKLETCEEHPYFMGVDYATGEDKTGVYYPKSTKNNFSYKDVEEQIDERERVFR